MNKQYWLGLTAYYIATLLRSTLKVTIQAHPSYQKNAQYLFAFWHGLQFLPAFELIRFHQGEGAVLVSPSKDGDIVSVWLKRLGYNIIRGSSRRNNIASLSQMMRGIKKGWSMGLGVDGPIGPIYKVKPGLTFMAQKYDTEIVPIGAALQSKWILKNAWDKYQIPKPFTEGVCYIGEPFKIDPSLDLDKNNLLLEESIHAANAKAIELLK